MDKLTRYRQLVQQILHDYSEQKPANGNIEVETIFDTERDHYQIVHVGWEGQDWVHSCIIHIDIKGGKIWLQWNGTEDDTALPAVMQYSFLLAPLLAYLSDLRMYLIAAGSAVLQLIS